MSVWQTVVLPKQFFLPVNQVSNWQTVVLPNKNLILEKQSAPTFTGPSEDIPGVVGDWKFSISSAESDETVNL